MRVLIVDDSPAIRERLVSLLGEVPGVELVQAAGADEAITAARWTAPDLVLLDLQMPGKSGLAALPRLKALRPAPVVVILTHDATDHHRRICEGRGADHFFDKAGDFEERVLALVRPTACAR